MISTGSLSNIANRKDLKNPIRLQVVAKQNQKKPTSITVKLSDGQHSIMSILMSDNMTDLAELQQYCVIQCSNPSLHIPQEEKQPVVLMVMNFQVIDTTPTTQIGNNLISLRRHLIASLDQKVNVKPVKELTEIKKEPITPEVPESAVLQSKPVSTLNPAKDPLHHLTLNKNKVMKLNIIHHPQKKSDQSEGDKNETIQDIKVEKKVHTAPKLYYDKPIHTYPTNIKQEKGIVRIPNKSEEKIQKNTPKITPFALINTMQNKINIKGRVIKKSERKIYKLGSMFTCLLQDSNGDEMELVCFNDGFVKYFNLIESNKTYIISKADFKQRSVEESRTRKMVDVQCIINKNTHIERTDDQIPFQSNIIKIHELNSLPLNWLYSVCGVVKEIREKEILRTNKIKQTIVIVDQSKQGIEVEFWGKEIEQLRYVQIGMIIVLEHVSLKEFQRRYLSFVDHSSLIINVSTYAEVKDLFNTFTDMSVVEEIGNSSLTSAPNSINLSCLPIMSLSEFDEYALKANGESVRALVYAYIHSFKTDWTITYTGCPLCRKRVELTTTECPYCNKEMTPSTYFVVKTILIDTTQTSLVVLYDDDVQILIGKSAEETLQMKENDNDAFTDLFKKQTLRQIQFALQGITEITDDGPTVRIKVVKVVYPTQWNRYSKHLIKTPVK
ncbi:Replication factor A protein 1 [Entamoeba marina]